jgi:hypothetical protein
MEFKDVHQDQYDQLIRSFNSGVFKLDSNLGDEESKYLKIEGLFDIRSDWTNPIEFYTLKKKESYSVFEGWSYLCTLLSEMGTCNDNETEYFQFDITKMMFPVEMSKKKNPVAEVVHDFVWKMEQYNNNNK